MKINRKNSCLINKDLSLNDIFQLTEYVGYYFYDLFSAVYKKSTLGANNKSEFKQNYYEFFNTDIKEPLLVFTTGNFHNTDIYILEFINPTLAFIFEKQNGNWKLTQINAGGG